MNCLCNFFEDNAIWILIIIAILLFCNNDCDSCGSANGGCGCGCR